MEFKVIHIDETDSTNGYFREIPCHSDANMVVVAEYQTAGKGCGSNVPDGREGMRKQ